MCSAHGDVLSTVLALVEEEDDDGGTWVGEDMFICRFGRGDGVLYAG